MLPGSTLFLDVCAQRDFWPDGAWPLVDPDTARNVTTLFALAASLGIRQGGVCCAHAPDQAAPSGMRHCAVATDGTVRAPGCIPAGSIFLVVPEDRAEPALDRTHAYYLTTGCARPVDAEPASRVVVDHLTAGVRDAMVFGAGIETALDHAVDALLRRRVRTHVVLDAAAAVDPARAQQVIESWKRRGVDGLTTATVARLLGRTMA